MVERLTYGNTHTFLLQGPTSSILVDTGYAGTLQAFYKAIKAQDIKVSDITYVLCTHFHPDHCGIAQEIADLTDGIRLIEEHSFNEEMRKYSIRGKVFAALLPKFNDRWATFTWG